MKTELPVWRSLMYVPVNVEKYVDKAHTRGADVIQLDLEDSVPPGEKERARTLVEKAAARKIIEMNDEAAKSGRGSFALDGKMIDIPISVRAEKLIRRSDAIREREAKTLAAMKG
jgi:citrate lyase subunit beta/citryl-CoA lyase